MYCSSKDNYYLMQFLFLLTINIHVDTLGFDVNSFLAGDYKKFGKHWIRGLLLALIFLQVIHFKLLVRGFICPVNNHLVINHHVQSTVFPTERDATDEQDTDFHLLETAAEKQIQCHAKACEINAGQRFIKMP